MRLSEILGLPWPEVDDLGALALYMEDLAWRLEDQLNAVNAPFAGFDQRPCGYWTNLAASVPVNGSTGIVWDTTPPIAFIGDTPTPSDAVSVALPAAVPGLWAVGCSFTNLLATTPNANTWRFVEFEVVGYAPTGPQPNYTGVSPTRSTNPTNSGEITLKNLETNTGAPGETNYVNTVAYVPPNALADPSTGALAELSVELRSDNDSSAIPVPAGSGFMWAVWLGSGADIIEQVG